jgi:hypothetical protein
MSLVVVKIVEIIKIITIVKIAGSWCCIDADVRVLLLLLSCCVVVTTTQISSIKFFHCDVVQVEFHTKLYLTARAIARSCFHMRLMVRRQTGYFIFIYSILFNDVISNSDYTAFNARVIFDYEMEALCKAAGDV